MKMATIKKIASNLLGRRLEQKIVVIESDDWGSIRMPSNEVLETLLDSGVDLDEDGESFRYSKFDTLASPEDLSLLFSVLKNHRDINGRHPVFTALSLVANPDFEKIERYSFDSYFWMSLEDTFKAYNRPSSLPLWAQGEKDGVFIPEFHGREHLNVPVWMRDLKNGNTSTLLAFKNGVWGWKNKNKYGIKYQAAFALQKTRDLEFQRQAILEGLDEFQRIHNRKAKYFVAPNGQFNNSLEYDLAEKGVEYIGASKVQLENLGEGRKKRVFNWLGKRNAFGQTYLTRNCFFEPSYSGHNWIQSCLNEIAIAFLCMKPAVISTHRVNYIGGLNEENRENGLSELDELLKQILRRWPDVIFMSSTELGEVVRRGYKNLNIPAKYK